MADIRGGNFGACDYVVSGNCQNDTCRPVNGVDGTAGYFIEPYLAYPKCRIGFDSCTPATDLCPTREYVDSDCQGYIGVGTGGATMFTCEY